MKKTNPTQMLILTILIGSIIVAFLWTLTETTPMSSFLATAIDNISFIILRIVLVISGLAMVKAVLIGFSEKVEK